MQYKKSTIFRLSMIKNKGLHSEGDNVFSRLYVIIENKNHPLKKCCI